MIDAAQIRADFEKLRSTEHPHGEIVTLGFEGATCRGLKSSRTMTVQVSDWGEETGDVFTVRFLVTDFPRVPKERDVVQVDGVDYQVGEVRRSGFQQIIRIFLLDEDSQ